MTDLLSDERERNRVLRNRIERLEKARSQAITERESWKRLYTIEMPKLAVERDQAITERDDRTERLACPGGCGCVFPNHPDANECGCDSLCNSEAWDSLSTLLDQERER